jgi:cytochrome c oxidase cbb3-type subunit I/II
MSNNETLERGGRHSEGWHRKNMERKSVVLAIATTIGISIGGIAEIIPMYSIAAGPEQIEEVTPYTALEQAGRDIYVREGCYNCHSQWVRPFRNETLRYGTWSRAGEYSFDRPFQLGSRRIGPDLHRVGGKYPDAWHYEHMRDPRSTSPGSIMPPYTWLLEDTWSGEDAQKSLVALQTLGTPYTDAQVASAPQDAMVQAEAIVGRLAQTGITTTPDKEVVALIAYLQRLGVDGRAAFDPKPAAPPPAPPAPPPAPAEVPAVPVDGAAAPADGATPPAAPAEGGAPTETTPPAAGGTPPANP